MDIAGSLSICRRHRAIAKNQAASGERHYVVELLPFKS
jgi:hypothetical protein